MTLLIRRLPVYYPSFQCAPYSMPNGLAFLGEMLRSDRMQQRNLSSSHRTIREQKEQGHLRLHSCTHSTPPFTVHTNRPARFPSWSWTTARIGVQGNHRQGEERGWGLGWEEGQGGESSRPVPGSFHPPCPRGQPWWRRGAPGRRRPYRRGIRQ